MRIRCRSTPDAFESGKQSDGLVALRNEVDDADIDTDEGESMLENLFGFSVDRTPTEQQARGRARFEYANQPSLDQVGAAFAFYDRMPAPSSSGNGLSAFQSGDRDGGLGYERTGAGSTVRYLTDRRFGTFAKGGGFRDSVGGHPELASSGGEALVRIWTDDINFSNRDILRFSPYVSRGDRTLFYTTNRDGTFQLQTSEAIRSATTTRFDPINPEPTPPEFQSVIQVRSDPSPTTDSDFGTTVITVVHPDGRRSRVTVPILKRLGVHTRTSDPAVLEEVNTVVTYDARNQWRQASGISDDVGYIVGRRSAVDRLVDLNAIGIAYQQDSFGFPLLFDAQGNTVGTDDSGYPLRDMHGRALRVDDDGNTLLRTDHEGRFLSVDDDGNAERDSEGNFLYADDDSIVLVDEEGRALRVDTDGNTLMRTDSEGRALRTDNAGNVVKENDGYFKYDNDGSNVLVDENGRSLFRARTDHTGRVLRVDNAGNAVKEDDGYFKYAKDGYPVRVDEDGRALSRMRTDHEGRFLLLDDAGNVARDDKGNFLYADDNSIVLVDERGRALATDSDGNAMRDDRGRYLYASNCSGGGCLVPGHRLDFSNFVLTYDDDNSIVPDESLTYDSFVLVYNNTGFVVPDRLLDFDKFLYDSDGSVVPKHLLDFDRFLYADDNSFVPRNLLDLGLAYGRVVGYAYDGLSVQTITHTYNNPWGATPTNFRGNVGVLLVPKDSLGNPLVDELGRALAVDGSGNAMQDDDGNFVYADDDSIVPGHLLDFTVGEEATASDIGLLALIRGLANPEDASNLATLRVATHGIAPGAGLDVYTTQGLRETSLCASIEHPSRVTETVGDCGTTGYGDVKAVRGVLIFTMRFCVRERA